MSGDPVLKEGWLQKYSSKWLSGSLFSVTLSSVFQIIPNKSLFYKVDIFVEIIEGQYTARLTVSVYQHCSSVQDTRNGSFVGLFVNRLFYE